MLFLLRDSPQKLKLEKIHGTSIFLLYVSLSSPSLQTFFLEKTHNKTTPQQVTGRKILNLVLKKIQDNIRILLLDEL